MSDYGYDVQGYGILVYPVGPGILPPFRLEEPTSVQLYVKTLDVDKLPELIQSQIDVLKKL